MRSLAGVRRLAALSHATLAVLLLASPHPASAQMDTLDLSRDPIATVIPAEYDGGFFARIGRLVVEDRGLWVIDSGQKKVLWFDPDGQLRVEYGREGEGPGEFLLPSSLRVDSMLTVIDPRQSRVVRFRLDGAHIETIAQPRFTSPDGMTVPLGDLSPLAGGYSVGGSAGYYTFSFSVEDKGDPFQHVVLFHERTAELDTLASYRISGGRWDARDHLGGNVATPFGVSGAWTVLGDSIVLLADGIEGTLTRVSIEGQSVDFDTVDLGIRARPVSRRDLGDLEASLRESRSDLPRRIELDVPAGWSVATALVAGSNGEFWLRQAVEGGRNEWVVVPLSDPPADISGAQDPLELSRVILPERFRLVAVHGGLLYGVVRDELDVPSVGALANPIEAEPVPEPA